MVDKAFLTVFKKIYILTDERFALIASGFEESLSTNFQCSRTDGFTLGKSAI